MPTFKIESDCPSTAPDPTRRDGRGATDWGVTIQADDLDAAFTLAESEFRTWYGSFSGGWSRVFRLDYNRNTDQHAHRLIVVHPTGSGVYVQEERTYPQAYGLSERETYMARRF